MESHESKEEKKQSHVKRDFLRDIEVKVQKEWADNKIFEMDAPDEKAEKFLATFPYPYMNGRMHLGHSFTLTKAEFAAGYQRLKGKRVLFPFGFHCTGMPIKACADKLKREMEEFGNPPVFPEPPKEEEAPKAPVVQETKKAVDPLAFHSKKSKAASKTGGVTYQWKIMKTMGLTDEEIPKFADANYWLYYFPPYCEQDLKKFGAGIDWRRSFITTDVNPFYDSFVRWQFEKLRELGKVQFGKRYTIFSPKDGQPCADHDRSSGEGVLPQEYTLIKLQLIDIPEKLKSFADKKIYLVPGTLRPETMYGQTNCWILPEGDYVLFPVKNNELFIATYRAAKNMAFQEITAEATKVEVLAELKGQELIGCAVKAPLSYYPAVYILPMATIDPEKGTGIVTSVPSDAPDDFICLDELKRKPLYREKLGLKTEMVEPFEVVPIIDIPEYGNLSAPKACKEFNVQGPKDREGLDKAKDLCYTKGFYEGIMMVGECKGTSVKDAKPKVKQMLIDTNQACVYSEPQGVVISRSGDECVVCLTDQWFLDYGEEKWRGVVEKHLQTMNFYDPAVKHKFEMALDWLLQWACSRTYGLGTRLPWDEKYLIDSLSDSTIYMAFYCVVQFLQSSLDGRTAGPKGIKAEQMTTEVWDYIFLKDKPFPEKSGIAKDILEKMKKEFLFWYPVDLRVSGKDLVTNHLVFFMYNHTAVWHDDATKWPKTIRANGHILVDGEKMSKSKGNFVILSDGIDDYTADGMRLALADAGDSLDDANFRRLAAEANIKRLYAQIKWVEEILAVKSTMRTGPADTFADVVFKNVMNKAIQETDAWYASTHYREALRTGFFDLQTARDNYKNFVGKLENMNVDLVLRFIEVQAIVLTPIAPHFSEYIWKLLGKTGSVRNASWPVTEKVDDMVLKQNKYLTDAVHSFRLKKSYVASQDQPKAKKEEKPKAEKKEEPKKETKPGKQPKQVKQTQPAKETGSKPKAAVVPLDPNRAKIYVAKDYPSWMQKVINLVRPFYEKAKINVKKTQDKEGKDVDEKTVEIDDKGLLQALRSDSSVVAAMQKCMTFVATLKQSFLEEGISAFDLELPFDENKFLTSVSAYLQQTLELTELEICYVEEENKEKCTPGRPHIQFLPKIAPKEEKAEGEN